MPINVAIMDHHTLLIKALKNYISGQSNINVVIQSPDVRDLLNKLKDYSVQVLLMDILPKFDGAEVVKLIRQEYPGVKILILSTCTDMELLSNMMDLGVYGYISKSGEPEELIEAIVSLSEQRMFRNKMFTEILYWNKENNVKLDINATTTLLNEREKEILKLLWEEKSNKEIADHLFLSVRSIEKIRQDLKEKIGVKSTVGLIKYAINKKIIGKNAELPRNFYNLVYKKHV